MIKQITLGCLAGLSLCGQASFADLPKPGPLFNLTKESASTFTVETTNPYRSCYNSVGIKNLSPYATVFSNDCIPNSQNGYCLFTACNAAHNAAVVFDYSHAPVVFDYSGPAGALDLKLCLNGKGKRGAGCETTFPGINIQYAYVADNGDGTDPGAIWKCGVHPNGELGSTDAGTGTCLNLVPSQTPPDYIAWGAPWKISFTNVNSSEYAYVADGTPGSTATNYVYSCLMNPNGETFESCIINDYFSEPRQVAFATIAGKQYAYVADPGATATDLHTVYQCQISLENGRLSDCVSQLDLEWDDGPVGVTVEKTGDTTYIYVPDSGPVLNAGYVRQCPLDSLGQIEALVNCNDMAPPAAALGSFSPVEVAFQKIGDTRYAYIADAANGVWTCPVSSTTGVINNVGCSLFPSTVTTIVGIAITTVYDADKNKIYHAYVSDVGGLNTVRRCNVSTIDGSLSGCLPTASGQTTWVPSGTTVLSDANETAPHG